MKINSISLLCLFVFLTMPCVNFALAGEIPNKTQIFSSWETFEVDKCASIWLIKRFINKDAEIKFFPPGSIITEGIPFDVPDAKFRRYHNMSTFESLMKHYDLKDAKLISIGKIIHDSEVNIWEKKVFDTTHVVGEKIISIINQSKTPAEIIEKSLQYFDLLYQQIEQVRIK